MSTNKEAAILADVFQADYCSSIVHYFPRDLDSKDNGLAHQLSQDLYQNIIIQI